MEYLFVYGTLRRQPGHKAHCRLVAHATFIALGKFPGRLYRVAGYPGAVTSTRPGEWVVGELYRIDSPSLLQLLDDYERCSDRYPEPREYLRRQMPIRLGGGREVRAWVYLYNRPVGRLERIASGDFLG